MGKKKPLPQCAVCTVTNRICTIPDGEGPIYCPTKEYKDVIEEAVKEYAKPEISARAPKEVIGVKDDEKIRIGEFESMCSPIIQATILNEEETDFNILVGLCVGHDSLFFKYSKAFTTVLVAKDRVLAHNPAGALYTTGSYYAKLLNPEANKVENSE